MFGARKDSGQVLIDPVKTSNTLNGNAPYQRGRSTQPKSIPGHVKDPGITRTYSSQQVPKAKPKSALSNSGGGRPKSGTVETTSGWSTLLAEYSMANESSENYLAVISVLHPSNTYSGNKLPPPTSPSNPLKRSESSMSPPTNRRYKVQARSLKAIQQRRDWIKNKNNLTNLQSTEPTDIDSVQRVKEIEQEIKKDLDDGELINFAEGAHLNPQLLKRDSLGTSLSTWSKIIERALH